MRRKNFFLSADLAERAEETARAMGIDFSRLAREAIGQYIEGRERERMERELIAACLNYRELNSEFSPEWAQYETRSE